MNIKKKALIYGVGNFFLQNKEDIVKNYEVIAFIDSEKSGWYLGKKIIKELCKNKFTVLAIYGIMAIRRYDHGRTNSYYAAIT